jgi:hypothetical protein
VVVGGYDDDDDIIEGVSASSDWIESRSINHSNDRSTDQGTIQTHA